MEAGLSEEWLEGALMLDFSLYTIDDFFEDNDFLEDTFSLATDSFFSLTTGSSFSLATGSSFSLTTGSTFSKTSDGSFTLAATTFIFFALIFCIA